MARTGRRPFHWLISLDGTEGVKQLADQHGEASRRSHEEMSGANVPVLTARRAHAVLNGKRNIRRLARRADHMRVASRTHDVHERAEWRESFLAHREHGLNVVGDGHQDRDVPRGRLFARDLRLEA